MGLDAGISDQLLVAIEHRHDQRRVLLVRAGAEGIVVEDDVARLQSVLAAHRLDRGFDAEVHGAHEERQRRRLGQQAHLAIVDRRSEVQDLVDGRREGGAHQRALHVVGRDLQGVPHHLGGHGIGILAQIFALCGAICARLALADSLGHLASLRVLVRPLRQASPEFLPMSRSASRSRVRSWRRKTRPWDEFWVNRPGAPADAPPAVRRAGRWRLRRSRALRGSSRCPRRAKARPILSRPAFR